VYLYTSYVEGNECNLKYNTKRSYETIFIIARFEALQEVTIKVVVFLDLTLYSLVNRYECFRGNCYLSFMMEERTENGKMVRIQANGGPIPGPELTNRSKENSVKNIGP
jgi:hypothetical protein